MRRWSLVFLAVLALAQPIGDIFPFPVASATFETGAYVTWNTLDANSNQLAGTSQINYGLTTAYGSSTTLDSTLVLNHAQTITGLTPGTTYHYQVISTDAGGNTVFSADHMFTTLAAPTGTVKTVKPSGGNFTSMQACSNALSVGVTCEIYIGFTDPGTACISVPHGGSSGSPVTFIAHDAILIPCISINTSQSFVTIEGFEISTAPFATFQTCSGQTHLILLGASNYIIQSNYIHNSYAGVLLRNNTFSTHSNNNQILNNLFAFAGMTNQNPPYSHPCTTSSSGFVGVDIIGDFNLFKGNDGKEMDHWVENGGLDNFYVGNTFHDTFAADWGSSNLSTHVDFFHPSTGTSANQHERHAVYENNFDLNRQDTNVHFGLFESNLDQSNSASLLGPGDGVTTTFSATLSLTNTNGTDTSIAPFSICVVVGNLPGTVSAVDDGFGNLTNWPGGSGVSSGTINYSTGAISVTFSSPPANGATIKAYYALNTFSSHDAIIRFNTSFNTNSFVGPGLGGFAGLRLYNNTLDYLGISGGAPQNTTCGIGLTGNGSNAPNPHWTVLNMIYKDCFTVTQDNPWGTPSANEPPAQTPGFGLVFTSSCDPTPGCSYKASTTGAPGMVISQDPKFNNPAAYDFSLGMGSPALKAGTFLTTVASTDTGSGTSLIVNDAGFFQDGAQAGGGIPGVSADCIAVTNVTNRVCITAINYLTNTVTLASGISRSVGDHVWLASDSTGRNVLLGPAPPMGGSPALPQPAPAPGLFAQLLHYIVGGSE